MLGPEDRTDRVEHALRWYAKNFKDGNTATAHLNLSNPSTLDAMMAKLYAVGAAHNIADKTIKTATSAPTP